MMNLIFLQAVFFFHQTVFQRLRSCPGSLQRTPKGQAAVFTFTRL